MEMNLGAIVLAAGEGKRMNSQAVNKVSLELGQKPMILRTAELLDSLNIETLVVVVGFAKESVIDILKDKAIFAEQKERLGTAHAVSTALEKIPEEITDVLILNGDDSALYSKETIEDLVNKHVTSGASFTLLTIEKDNSFGLGRVVRDSHGNITDIVEEKDATPKQRKIKEINPGCYVFKVDFLKKYLPKIEKSSVTGEYYLTSLIKIAIENNEKIETLRAGKLVWRGINTLDELMEAEKLIRVKNKE
jgi:bifunctional UDP-N-acetylglucosamine pyrophosphorylase/glucosamine-1-phosphate N-acetyltransferase